MAAHTRSYVVTGEQAPVWEMEPGRPTTFKLLSEQTGGSVALFEEVVPVGSGTPLHIHHTSDEIIYILAGAFTLKIDGSLVTAESGTCVFIPRGTPHAWKNSGSEAARATFTFTPAAGAKFFETLRLLEIPVTEVDLETLETICRQHGYELVSFDWE
jgi:quercetin dioxygenase-like cupin family protein